MALAYSKHLPFIVNKECSTEHARPVKLHPPAEHPVTSCTVHEVTVHKNRARIFSGTLQQLAVKVIEYHYCSVVVIPCIRLQGGRVPFRLCHRGRRQDSRGEAARAGSRSTSLCVSYSAARGATKIRAENIISVFGGVGGRQEKQQQQQQQQQRRRRQQQFLVFYEMGKSPVSIG